MTWLLEISITKVLSAPNQSQLYQFLASHNMFFPHNTRIYRRCLAISIDRMHQRDPKKDLTTGSSMYVILNHFESICCTSANAFIFFNTNHQVEGLLYGDELVCIEDFFDTGCVPKK